MKRNSKNQVLVRYLVLAFQILGKVIDKLFY